jgi:enamine deaminase RidA (YjgF/YER057c/UK114 family)
MGCNLNCIGAAVYRHERVCYRLIRARHARDGRRVNELHVINQLPTGGSSMSIEFLGASRSGAGGQSLPFSTAVRAGPFVFVSGQVAMGDNGEIVPGGIETQTRQVLANVERALKLAGCTLGDTRDFWSFNRVYAEFFPGDKPARSTTQAKLMVDAKIEIEVIGYKA